MTCISTISRSDLIRLGTVIYLGHRFVSGRRVPDDRTGNRKRLLLVTVVAFSLCSFASGLAVSFVTLFATRLLMGLAEGPDTLPIAQSLVAIESTAARRGNNMGVMQNFGSQPPGLIRRASRSGGRRVGLQLAVGVFSLRGAGSHHGAF